MTQPKTNFLKVNEFNEVFGHPAPSEEQLSIFEESPNIVNLRNSLINEEITELNEAVTNEDVIEIIDALSDTQYVAYGLLVVYGVDGDKAYTKYMDEKYEILECVRNDEVRNMTNFNQTCQFISSILNGDTFIGSPNDFLDRYTQPSFRCSFNNYLEDLLKGYQELEKATNNSHFNDTIAATMNIIYITYVLGSLIGVDIDESVKLVHESNMSKICVSAEEAELTVQWYRENESRYDSPAYRESNAGFIVYNESTGKILKNIHYKAVDLSVFMS